MRPTFMESVVSSARKIDRIRAVTAPEINARIDKESQIRIWWYATRSRDELDRRFAELDEECYIEHYLESKSSLLALSGMILGAPQGKDVVTMLRKIGVRTRTEIDHERHALMVLKGHFDDVDAQLSCDPPETPLMVVEA
jgi:hypothetical protein